jgi:Carboxypeptidase regulatory-like domain
LKRLFVAQLLTWTALAQVQGGRPVAPPIPPSPIRVSGQISQTGEGVIEGLVKRTNSEDPISEVQITLTGGPPAGEGGTVGQLRTTTDANGQFHFRNLPSGRYTVGLQREGYFRRYIPSSSEETLPPGERSGGPIVVGAGRSVTTVVYRLTRGGTITGRVLDPAGRPAAMAIVWAARPSYQDGRISMINAKQTTTDDRGEYRLFWLEPGEYFVLAEKNLTSGPARSYYPGDNDGRSAIRVRVEEATESGKIDFSLSASPATRSISGVVTNLIPGLETLPSVQFYAIPIDGRRLNDGFESLANTLTNDQDRAAGKFELRNVSAGSYELYAVVQDRSISPARYYVAHSSIDVEGDVTGVALRMGPGIDLNGSVLLGGQTPTKPVRIELRPKVPFPNFLGTAVVSTDGTFAIPNLPESSYRIWVESSEPNSYIDELLQGANSILNRGIVTVVRGLPDTLHVRLKSPASAVRGVVLGGVEQLSVGIVVTLVPDEGRRENLALYKRAIAHLDGSFTIDAVAPGKYRLYAWDAIPDGAEQNDEFMEAYKNSGTEIDVPVQNTTSIKLRLNEK